MLKVRICAVLLCYGIATTVHAEEANNLSPNIMNPDAIMAGRDYQAIDPPQPQQVSGKVEVVEAFSYACPHCNEFESHLETWRAQLPKDVVLQRLPVVFGREPWRLLAKAYFAAEKLGVVDRMNAPIFAALHKEQRKLDNESALAELFATNGVSKDAFIAAFRSDATARKVKEAEALAMKYKISGVPSIIVAGKYLTSATMTGDYPTLLRAVDHLIGKERSGIK